MAGFHYSDGTGGGALRRAGSGRGGGGAGNIYLSMCHEVDRISCIPRFFV